MNSKRNRRIGPALNDYKGKTMEMNSQSMWSRLVRLAVGVSAAGLLLAPVPAIALTHAYGLLLSNYSNYNAEVLEVTNPAPACINNQGSIPYESVGPGSIDQPVSNNLNVEISDSCSDENVDYPFVLTINGATSNAFEFTIPPAPQSCQSVPSGDVGTVLNMGIEGMQCQYNGSVSDGLNSWFLSNPLVEFPASQNFYVVMYALPYGSDTPCSASNWNTCVRICVYNNGEGPYATGVLTTDSLTTESLATVPLPAVHRPVLLKPAVTSTLGGVGRQVVVTVDTSVGRVAPQLVTKYGKKNVGNDLWVLVLAQDSDGREYKARGRRAVSVVQSGTPLLKVTFDRADSRKMLRTIRRGGAVKYDVQLRQLVRTPHETFELSTDRSVRVHGQ